MLRADEPTSDPTARPSIVAMVAACGVLAVAGCGAEEPGGAGVDPAAGTLPATTLLVSPTLGATPVEISPTPVTEPCPEPAGDSGDGDAMSSEASRLEPMLGQVLAYGGRFPDQFGTYGLLWDGSDASVFISFTSDLDTHRTALGSLVEYPDELVVCQVAIPGDVALQLQTELVQELDGRFLSIGRGLGAVEIVLGPGEDALADELIARYGDAIELMVGDLPYPLDDAVSVCPDAPDESLPPELGIQLVSSSEPVIPSGPGHLDFEIELTNLGDAAIQVESGTARGVILTPDGNVVSSGTNVLVGDIGITIDLAPGESQVIPLVATTASCDPALGTELPSGDYRLVAVIPSGTDSLRSGPIPFTLGD